MVEDGPDTPKQGAGKNFESGAPNPLKVDGVNGRGGQRSRLPLTKRSCHQNWHVASPVLVPRLVVVAAHLLVVVDKSSG